MVDKRVLGFLVVLIICGPLNAGAPIKVACIGNSITQGNMGGVYVPTLQNLLDSGYTVQNDGISGTTMLRAGDNPYWKNGKLPDVFNLQPDIVTIKLGTNDTKSYNWNGRASQFKKDYELMVDTVANMASRPKVWVVIPVPIWNNTYGIQAGVLQEMIPILWQVAFDKKVPLIDAYTPLLNFRQYFSDGVHPNQAGADSIASVIYRALSGPPHMLFSDTAVVCTVSTGRPDISAARYVSVCNTTHSPVLDSITVTGAADWLVTTSASIDRNHQKIGFAADGSKAPRVAGTYTDTVTLSAENAQPPSRKIIVKLIVKQGTGVASTNSRYLRPVIVSSTGAAGFHETAVTIPATRRFHVKVFDLRGGCLKSVVVDGTGTRRIGLPARSPSVYLVHVTDEITAGRSVEPNSAP
ncbi:MAG: hypothetical protein JXA18_16345 [Chitinispirillaceae bacterium]|nr:hypothetical protein [Chitinispirillaceae bacterium]